MKCRFHGWRIHVRPPKKYRARYSDVAAAYGDDWPRYYAHYIKYGKAEGRSGRTS